MDKDVLHVYNEILLRHKKHEIMPFAAKWMQLEIITLSEVRKRKTNTVYITYMWNPKYGTNEPIYGTETKIRGIENRLWLPRGRRVGEGRSGRLGLADANFYICYRLEKQQGPTILYRE